MAIVNILRQLRYGAGGFSYKSRWTLQELFPLINCGCKCCQIATIKIIKHERYGYEFENLARKKGIPSTTQTSQPPRRKDKKMRDEKRESDEIESK